MKPLLLYHTGRAPDAIASVHGGYSRWFGRLLADHPVAVTEHDGVEPAPLPDPRGFAGIVMTGSPASLTAPEHWMEGAVETIRECHRFGTPLLGVCFGHQLIGAAYGAAVVEHPDGWRVGTARVTARPDAIDDPLLEGVLDDDGGFWANFSHRDVVDSESVSPLNGLRMLAGNDRCATQVLAARDHIRGVQFHPEFDAAITSAHVRYSFAELAAEATARGADDEQPDRSLERVSDTPASARIVHNFVRNFVARA